eukprot:3303797-Pleurochrysis_carterae.AAC.1
MLGRNTPQSSYRHLSCPSQPFRTVQACTWSAFTLRSTFLPGVSVTLTPDFIAAEWAEMQAMSVQMLTLHQRAHRKSHYGKEEHAELAVLFGHAERAPSLLHHRINTWSAAI